MAGVASLAGVIRAGRGGARGNGSGGASEGVVGLRGQRRWLGIDFNEDGAAFQGGGGKRGGGKDERGGANGERDIAAPGGVNCEIHFVSGSASSNQTTSGRRSAELELPTALGRSGWMCLNTSVRYSNQLAAIGQFQADQNRVWIALAGIGIKRDICVGEFPGRAGS